MRLKIRKGDGQPRTMFSGDGPTREDQGLEKESWRAARWRDTLVLPAGWSVGWTRRLSLFFFFFLYFPRSTFSSHHNAPRTTEPIFLSPPLSLPHVPKSPPNCQSSALFRDMGAERWGYGEGAADLGANGRASHICSMDSTRMGGRSINYYTDLTWIRSE